MAIKLGFPIRVTDNKLVQYLRWDGFCAFIIIFFAAKKPARHVIRHQMIRYHQYKEMFIFPFIFTYLAFLIGNYIIYGYDIDRAFRTNPFEIEADYNERKRSYLKKRKFLAWIDYIGQEIPEYDEDDDSIQFHTDDDTDTS